MYLDMPVMIPKKKGIYYKKKGDSTYVQYETGRRYDPDKQYNIPEFALIGLQIPGNPEMMLPNENYLRYFDLEIANSETDKLEELEKHEDERQRKYLLRELFFPMFYEFQLLGRRLPNEIVNEIKVTRLNRILTPLREMMAGEEYAEFLEPIPVPEVHEENGKETVRGLTYSDVGMILVHYKSTINRYFRKRL